MEKILKTLEYERIPIKNAIIKFKEYIKISNTDRWIKDHIIRLFKDILLIEKVKNLINFKLYS